MKTFSLKTISLTIALLPALLPFERALAAVQDETASVDRWIREGRAHLAAGRAVDAQAAFEEAARLEGGSLRTRMWVVRSWLPQERINDALDAIDELSRNGASGPEIDYLYGMAFSAKAQQYEAQGVRDFSVGMHYTDATDFLIRATKADPERFSDAFVQLARCALNSQRLEEARAAAEEAVRRFPEEAEGFELLGTIALNQYIVAQADEKLAEAADAHWKRAIEAFEAAVERLGEPLDGALRKRMADNLMQLAFTHLWKQQAAEAADAFGRAMGWDPNAVDYRVAMDRLGADDFRAALERGAKDYEARNGKDTTLDATLLWWLGYAQFLALENEAADATFQRVLKKWPQYVSSWYYIARARLNAKDAAGATEALHKGWDADPATLLSFLSQDKAADLARLEYLVGQAFQGGNLGDAAFLSRICAEVAVDEARYWNNLGLFLRDQGESLARKQDGKVDAEILAMWEEALGAYRRALELTPEDPDLLNSAGVLLHYNLQRDFEQAMAWYERAKEVASRNLEQPNLTAELRDLYRTALRDSTNNIAVLKKEMQEREAPAPPKEGAPTAGS